MSLIERFPDAAYDKGKSTSLISEFTVTGLYGYKDISFESAYASSIIIAGNGSGKTTLLSVMNAVLKKQFTRLRDIEFHTIRIAFYDAFDDAILNRDDIDHFCSLHNSKIIRQYAAKIQVAPHQLFTFIMEEVDGEMDVDDYYGHPVLKTMFPAEGYNAAKVNEQCEKIRNDLYVTNPHIKSMTNYIDQHMKNIEVVYLPTYRRIETALIDETEPSPRGVKKKPKIRFRTSSLYNLDIQFGLADIVHRLSQMNLTVISRSNQAYSRLSANIINDLLDGTFDRTEINQFEIPEQEEMSLFLGRIQAAQHYGPYRRVQVPNLDSFYHEDRQEDSNLKFLGYFLSQLGNVLSETKQIESDIEEFIKGCNKYLSLEDLSTQPVQEAYAREHSLSDGKKMFLNRKDLTVEVHENDLDRIIPLETLSSGEKQMISILARLYLYSKDKLVLIDEPELSLSMDWQRQILLDVLMAPRCKQLIAITHSPFVFDNALEPFAKSLAIKNVQRS